jgi:hypothetical protein
MIYEYALSGLVIGVAKVAESSPSRGILTACDMNSKQPSDFLAAFCGLTIASHQLYAETRSLIIRLNQVNINPKTVQVLDTIPDRVKRDQIRTVRMTWAMARMLEFDYYELNPSSGTVKKENWKRLFRMNVAFFCRSAILSKLGGLERGFITGWPYWEERNGQDTEDMFAALRSLAGKQNLEFIKDQVK